MSLLNKLTSNIKEHKPKSDDTVADALERALANTTPKKAGTPWQTDEKLTEDKEDEVKAKLYDRLMGR